MKAKALIPGQEFMLHGRRMIFVKRLRNGHEISGATRNVFRCPDYARLNGPHDTGLVEFSDQMLAVVSNGGEL
jgi:hypothetical protein